jgi:oligoendopeptidase F
LLASGAIRHAIVKVKVAVKLNRYLEHIDREIRDAAIRATSKARAAGAIG